MSILSFKIGKFKTDIPRAKRLKDLFTENASPPLRNLVFFKKKRYQKTMISGSKT